MLNKEIIFSLSASVFNVNFLIAPRGNGRKTHLLNIFKDWYLDYMSVVQKTTNS